MQVRIVGIAQSEPVSDVFFFRAGDTPLLVSVPHDGRAIPYDVDARMTPAGKQLPDTDWHVAKLYDFVDEIGASLLIANFSRYVVDLNRSADDQELYPGQVKTGLCPEQTFAGEDLYAEGGVGDDEKVARIKRYWRPYHDKIASTLESLRQQFGYALLWDAHSIPSVVPRLFDGELPALNLGSNGGSSCGDSITSAVHNVAEGSGYSSVLNGRFQGGYITRHYGDPGGKVHALQLEIAQRAYMDEVSTDYDATKAVELRDTLREMLNAFMDAAKE